MALMGVAILVQQLGEIFGIDPHRPGFALEEITDAADATKHRLALRDTEAGHVRNLLGMEQTTSSDDLYDALSRLHRAGRTPEVPS
jgi:hypothetical protein